MQTCAVALESSRCVNMCLFVCWSIGIVQINMKKNSPLQTWTWYHSLDIQLTVLPRQLAIIINIMQSNSDCQQDAIHSSRENYGQTTQKYTHPKTKNYPTPHEHCRTRYIEPIVTRMLRHVQCTYVQAPPVCKMRAHVSLDCCSIKCVRVPMNSVVWHRVQTYNAQFVIEVVSNDHKLDRRTRVKHKKGEKETG